MKRNRDSAVEMSRTRERRPTALNHGVLGVVLVTLAACGGGTGTVGTNGRPGSSGPPTSVDYIECQDHTTIPKQGPDAGRAPQDVAQEKCPHMSGTIVLAHCPNGIIAQAGVDITDQPGPPRGPAPPPKPGDVVPGFPIDPCAPVDPNAPSVSTVSSK